MHGLKAGGAEVALKVRKQYRKLIRGLGSNPF